MNNIQKIIFIGSGIALLCLLSLSFQKPQQTPISPVRPVIRVDSFYAQTARFEQTGDWLSYERLCVESGRDADARKDVALEAAVTLRLAQLAQLKNSMDNTLSAALYESALRSFQKNDTARWQQDAASYGLAQSYCRQAYLNDVKGIDSLLKPIIDLDRKPISAFAADALFLSALNVLRGAGPLGFKQSLPVYLATLRKISNSRKEYEWLLQAALAIDEGKLPQAESLLQQAAEKLKNTPFQDEAKRVLCELYVRASEAFSAKNEQKLKYSNLAAAMLSPAFQSKQDSSFCPDAEHFLPDFLSLRLLNARADVLLKIDSSAALSEQTLRSFAGFAAIMQNHLYKNDNRNYWVAANTRAYSKLMNNALVANKKDLQELFFLSERNKAQEIWIKLKKFNGKEATDSLQALEQRLAIDQSFWTFQVNRQQVLNEAKLLPSFEQKLKEVERQRDELHAQLLKKQKNYLTLKFGAQIPKLKDLQAKLEPDMQILSYFYHIDKCYLLSISTEKSELFAIDTVLEKELFQFSAQIKAKEKAADFAEKANYLYKKLLAPALKGENKRLLIIPSGPLVQVPFDLLCTELPKGKASYKKLPYLFRKQRVSYQYSVASWFDASSESISPASYYIMAMSPSSDSLRNLQSDYLLKRFSATTYKGVAAKKAVFLEQAPRYGFIHLGYNANKMGLLFGENENLSDAEREKMKLNTALVLLPHLSVPNVFNVELEFLHAGAGSLLSSFWDVEDETASVEFFNYFYEYLQKGLSKDEALRRARLEYLEKMPDDKLAPLYWGQFRQVGDFRNVAVSEPISYIWWYLLPILGMLAVGWWAMRGLRQRR